MTSALAGGACGAAQQAPGDVGAVVSIPAATVAPPTSSASAQAARETSLDGGPRPTLPEVTDDDASDDDEDDSLASSFKLSPQPAKCDNAAGNPAACAVIKPPGPACESFTDTKDQCGKMRAGFKARVAEKAVQCFVQASGTRAICDFQKPTKCAVLALQSTCIDAATEPKCRSIVAGCGRGRRGSSLPMDLCQAALSAVTDRNRTRLTACMTEGCDVTHCFWDLK